MTSPTAHTMQFLRENGVKVIEVVEKWIPCTAAGYRGRIIRKDLFDCIDILAVQGQTLLAIQSTAGSAHADRLAKAMASDKIKAYLGTGNLFEIWSWSRRAKRNPDNSFKLTSDGERHKRKEWRVRVTQLCLVDGKVMQA